MPPFGNHKKSRSSNIVVTIKYGGIKATQFFSKYTPEAYKRLMDDLIILGIPHPKKDNIIFLSHGTLEFYWPIPFNHKGPLVTNLIKKISLPEEGSLNKAQSKLRKDLSITSMTVREDEFYNPYLEHQDPVPSSSNTWPPPRDQYRDHLPTAPAAERFHPYARPTSRDSSRHATNSHPPVHNNNNSNNSPRPSAQPRAPPERFTSNQQAAQLFLDEIQTSLGPIQPPRPRPVQTAMPPLTIPQHPQRTAVKQEPASPSVPPLSADRLNYNRAIAAPPRTDHTFEMEARVTHRRTSSSASRSTRHPRSLTPDIPTWATAQLPRPDEPVRVRENHSDPTPPYRPSPNASDPPTVQQLSRELSELRNQISAAVEKERSVVEQLYKLNAAHVPSQIPFGNANGEFVTKTQLIKVQEELESERAKRLEMENVLKDVERERQEPFIVPALLEAFVKVSKATTAAVHHMRTPSLNR